jgi:hypothetical protein
MKNCNGCNYAIWKKTKTDKLHPSGAGVCGFEYKIPPLPGSRYFIGMPVICGGSINRKETFKENCVYYQSGSGNKK